MGTKRDQDWVTRRQRPGRDVTHNTGNVGSESVIDKQLVDDIHSLSPFLS